MLSFIIANFNKQISCTKKPFQVSFKQSIPTYLHTYLHTYILTYIQHTYLCTYLLMYLHIHVYPTSRNFFCIYCKYVCMYACMHIWYNSKVTLQSSTHHVLAIDSSFTQAFKLWSRKLLYNRFIINFYEAKLSCASLQILIIWSTCAGLSQASVTLYLAQHRVLLCCNHATYYCLFELVSSAKQENLPWSNVSFILRELQLLVWSQVFCQVAIELH